MNLNFYPTDFNNPFLNGYSPYLQPYNNQQYNVNNLQQKVEESMKQLSQIQSQTQNQSHTQPYYLFCGNKSDWDEFLMLNYGITEQAIFNDYNLFLQAKQELLEEQGQNKINSMKDKIKNKGAVNVDSTIKSNVKPTEQNSIVQPVVVGAMGTAVMGDNVQLDNGHISGTKEASKHNGKKR